MRRKNAEGEKVKGLAWLKQQIKEIFRDSFEGCDKNYDYFDLGLYPKVLGLVGQVEQELQEKLEWYHGSSFPKGWKSPAMDLIKEFLEH